MMKCNENRKIQPINTVKSSSSLAKRISNRKCCCCCWWYELQKTEFSNYRIDSLPAFFTHSLYVYHRIFDADEFYFFSSEKNCVSSLAHFVNILNLGNEQKNGKKLIFMVVVMFEWFSVFRLSSSSLLLIKIMMI